MSGLRTHPSSRRTSTRNRAASGKPSAIMRKVKRIAFVAPIAFASLTSAIGHQDIISLLAEQKKETPRWMMALEPARYTSTFTPTIALASTSAHGDRSDPVLTLTSSDNSDELVPVTGLKDVAKEQFPTVIPDEIAINRTAKGDRLIARAPDRHMVDMAAGAVFSLPSLLDGEDNDHLPRVAFVKPEPLHPLMNPMGQAGTTDLADDSPLNLQRVMMARNAAAASFSLVSAYAPDTVENTKDPFDALFGAAKYEQDMPPPEDPENPHWWAQKPLPASSYSPKQQKCLAEAIYFEARGEIQEGQVAVGQVVLNRVKNPAYPDTICGVVYQNKNKRNRCQFSFACDGIPDRITQPASWKLAEKIAMDVTDGKSYSKMVDASTHYHATYVKPRWAKSMSRRGKIGLHIFYKTYAGGWN